MKSEKQVHPGSIMYLLLPTVFQMTLFEKHFIPFLYMSLYCMLCRTVVLTIQLFSPILSCIILPLFSNLWYIYFICDIATVIRSGGVINLWNGKINILRKRFGGRALTCFFLFKSNLFQ